MYSIAAAVAVVVLGLVGAGPAQAACTLPPAPVPTVAPGPAPEGNRLPLDAERPTAIICHTVKGKGIPFAEHDPSWHHKAKLPAETVVKMYEALE